MSLWSRWKGKDSGWHSAFAGYMGRFATVIMSAIATVVYIYFAVHKELPDQHYISLYHCWTGHRIYDEAALSSSASFLRRARSASDGLSG